MLMCAEYYKRKNYSILLILIFEYKNKSYEMFFVNEVLPSKFLALLEYV